MPRTRRKLSAAQRDFIAELDRLERLDNDNQQRFSTTTPSLSRNQLWFLTEAIFFRSFRAYEGFVREIFLLYCLEKRPSSGTAVKSYLNPRDFLHAEELMKSSQRFLDWTSPDSVISRADLYLKNGIPVKLPYSTNLSTLKEFHRLRNHIAHDSEESLNGYKKVLLGHYGVIPLRIPSPGEFLLLPDRSSPSMYKLQVFFRLMRQLSCDLT